MAAEGQVTARVGLVLGLGLFVACLVTPPPEGLSEQAWRVAGVALLMAVWWACETLPLAATALIPVAVLPLLGVGKVDDIGGGYGNSTVFLILGGFLVALAMERWNLHKRIAYSIVTLAGGHARALVLGVMGATAFISMWATNTATTLMMMPVALAVAAVVTPDADTLDRDRRNFATCIVLAVAYGATIGGLGTIIGTPTNALVVGFLETNYDVSISFLQWMSFGMPVVLLMLPLGWLLMVRVALPFNLGVQMAAGDAVRDSLAQLGSFSVPERRVAIVFAAMAVAWVTRPLLLDVPGLGSLNDTGIALVAGLTLFVLPAGTGDGARLLDWHALKRVPWDVLILFGGGLALAESIQQSGLSGWAGEQLSVLSVLPLAALILGITVLLIAWTELNSNVAAAATAMPVLAAIAAGTDHPVVLLAAPAAIAASCGFMMPVGTPPNAIAYGTGRVRFREMLSVGLLLNLLAVIVVTTVALVVLPWWA